MFDFERAQKKKEVQGRRAQRKAYLSVVSSLREMLSLTEEFEVHYNGATPFFLDYLMAIGSDFKAPQRVVISSISKFARNKLKGLFLHERASDYLRFLAGRALGLKRESIGEFSENYGALAPRLKKRWFPDGGKLVFPKAVVDGVPSVKDIRRKVDGQTRESRESKVLECFEKLYPGEYAMHAHNFKLEYDNKRNEFFLKFYGIRDLRHPSQKGFIEREFRNPINLDEVAKAIIDLPGGYSSKILRQDAEAA